MQASLTVGAPAAQLFERASSLLAGVRVLSKAGASTEQAAVFLGSWTLELLLKTHLARVGKAKKELNPIRHNLAALWRAAAESGLDITANPPVWCEQLSATHDRPFVQRYDTNVAAWVSPNVETLLGELNRIHAALCAKPA